MTIELLLQSFLFVAQRCFFTLGSTSDIFFHGSPIDPFVPVVVLSSCILFLIPTHGRLSLHDIFIVSPESTRRDSWFGTG